TTIPVAVRRPSGTRTRRPGSGSPRPGPMRYVNSPSAAGTFSATAYSSFAGIVFLFLGRGAHPLGLQHFEARGELPRRPELDDARKPLPGGGVAVLQQAEGRAPLRDQASGGGIVLVQPELRGGEIAPGGAEHVSDAVAEPRQARRRAHVRSGRQRRGPQRLRSVCGRNPAMGEERTGELQ